ncbi:Hypothetical predicted protein [Mytilus galloprovincialis]|uniref:Uncharacterized protein n=1 Tax=Mytilus galloprovincialis TaxID=29158 RepID=A0A8B6CKC0_MYTGA|nr:Hypothetical predicted protein [Mytilus galloprovincialis]
MPRPDRAQIEIEAEQNETVVAVRKVEQSLVKLTQSVEAASKNKGQQRNLYQQRSYPPLDPWIGRLTTLKCMIPVFSLRERRRYMNSYPALRDIRNLDRNTTNRTRHFVLVG